MNLDKVHHYLAYSFLAILVVTQSMIWVAASAANSDYEIKANYLSPNMSQKIQAGQKPVIEAALATVDKDQLSQVSFSIDSLAIDYHLNIEAQNIGNNIWQSLASWDTTGLPTGLYYITAVGKTYQNGELTNVYDSKPKSILVENFLQDINNREDVDISIVGEEELDMISTSTPESPDQEEPDLTPPPPQEEEEVVATSTPEEILEPEEVADVAPIVLVSPDNSSTINSNNFSVNIETTFEASNLSIELNHATESYLGTNFIDVPYIDGYSWISSINLADYFINGDYYLTVIATNSADSSIMEERFNLTLDLGEDADQDLPDEGVILQISNQSTLFSGSVQLEAFSNETGLNVYFILQDATTGDELWRSQAVSSNNEHKVQFNTTDWDNGSYILFAQANNTSDQLVTSDKITISISNEENNETQDGLNTDNNSGNTTSLNTGCQELGISDQAKCQEFLAKKDKSLNSLCLTQQIYDGMACEDYLNRLYVDAKCQEEKIINKAECQNYLLEKYGSQVECRLSNSDECASVLKEKYINRLSLKAQAQENIDEVAQNYQRKSISVNNLRSQLSTEDQSLTSISLANTEKNVLVVPVQKKISLETNDQLTFRSNMALMIDTDGDGLPDDLESYYGTSATNKDSDGDGYEDWSEIQNGYNPAGDGTLDLPKNDLASALVASSLAQPYQQSGNIDADWSVSTVSNSGNGLLLQGKADARTWIAIYIYSDIPLLLATETDGNGQWSYNLKDTLAEGIHHIYLAQYNDQGQLLKQSLPNIFAINQAQAASLGEYFGAEQADAQEDSQPIDTEQDIQEIDEDAVIDPWWQSDTFYMVALFGGAAIMIVVWILYRRHYKQEEEEEEYSEDETQ